MDEHDHNDDQILKVRVSHMIKLTWLKTDEHDHNDDQILKVGVSHMVKFAWLKPTSSFSKKENKNQGTREENFACATNEEKARVNHLTRKLPCIKCNGTRISRHEREIKPPKTFHIPMLVQTKDDKGVKGATDE